MKVAVIAALGFVVGVAWPRLLGIRLGPSAPESAAHEPLTSVSPMQASSPVADASPAETSVAAAAPVTVTRPAPPGSSTAAQAAVESPVATMTIGHGFIFSCKSADGDSLKGGECGKLPGLDGVVLPRLRTLEDCPAARPLNGNVHLVVRPDFVRGALSAEFGRSQGPDAPEALLACARASLAGTSLSGLKHDHPNYAVAYTLAFGSVGGSVETRLPSSGRAAPSAATDGPPEIVWDVALVRDAPKTGRVIARLPRGTSVRLGSSRDGWYPITFGEGFSTEGWVYRGAVGR